MHFAYAITYRAKSMQGNHAGNLHKATILHHVSILFSLLSLSLTIHTTHIVNVWSNAVTNITSNGVLLSYVSWFKVDSKLVADRFEAGRRPTSNLSATSFDPASVMEFGFYFS